jgi:hypothetical protein
MNYFVELTPANHITRDAATILPESVLNLSAPESDLAGGAVERGACSSRLGSAIMHGTSK